MAGTVLIKLTGKSVSTLTLLPCVAVRVGWGITMAKTRFGMPGLKIANAAPENRIKPAKTNPHARLPGLGGKRDWFPGRSALASGI